LGYWLRLRLPMVVMDEDNEAADTRGPFTMLFKSCASDPRGTVHRAWSCSLAFIVIFSIVTVIEVWNLQNAGASLALILAAVWTVIVQISMAITGTFIIKRFSTSFSIGFLGGSVLIVAQQNLLLSVTFWNSRHGSNGANYAFANFAFALFAIHCVFAATLAQFRDDITIESDVKGIDRSRKSGISTIDCTSGV